MAEQVDACLRRLREPSEHDVAQAVSADDAGALLHLPVRRDAQRVFRARPQFLERIADADARRPTFRRVAPPLFRACPAAPATSAVAQLRDRTFGGVWLACDRLGSLAVRDAEQLPELRPEHRQRLVGLRLAPQHAW